MVDLMSLDPRSLTVGRSVEIIDKKDGTVEKKVMR
jgi:hypothetical protein